MRLSKIRLTGILKALLMVILVIDCFSIYYKTLGYQVTQIAAIIISIALIFTKNQKQIRILKDDMNLLAYILFSFFFLFVFADYKYLGFISGGVIPIILFFLLIFGCLNREDLRDLIRIFETIILILAVISLVFYLLGTNLKLIEPTAFYSADTIGWADFNYQSYFGIYFEGQRTFFFGNTWTRNIGIFLEGPVYAYVLTTALFFELFFKEQPNKLIIIIFAVTIATTFSTTAIAIGAILIYLYFYNHYMKRNLLKLLAPLILIAVLYFAGSVIMDKVAIGNDSGAARSDDFVACWKTFINNPIIGTGYNNVRGVDPWRAAFRRTGKAGMSSGIPFVFANGGILHGMLYVLPVILILIKVLRSEKFNKLNLLGFVATQTLLLTVTITEYTLLAEFLLMLEWYIALHYERLALDSFKFSYKTEF